MNEIPVAARCHPLRGNLKGLYAVDLIHPYRLLFKPDHEPLPLLNDGGLDITKVTQIIITELKIDYH